MYFNLFTPLEIILLKGGTMKEERVRVVKQGGEQLDGEE